MDKVKYMYICIQSEPTISCLSTAIKTCSVHFEASSEDFSPACLIRYLDPHLMNQGLPYGRPIGILQECQGVHVYSAAQWVCPLEKTSEQLSGLSI